MKPRPLQWGEAQKPNTHKCSYDHVIARTTFGEIRIEWKSWKQRPSFDAQTPWGFQLLHAENLIEAKMDIEVIWRRKLLASLLMEPSHPKPTQVS
jgi:hypothetical protein